MDANEAKTLIKKLKRGKRGWSMTLPAEAGMFLEKRIDVSVRTALLPGSKEPPLSDKEIELLTTVLVNLPKLAARAQKAWENYGGCASLDEDDRISRPRIWISREREAGKAAGAWTIIVEIAGSDFGWHIEFVRTKFKEIWAGD